jgi:prophage regulatory protein
VLEPSKERCHVPTVSHPSSDKDLQVRSPSVALDALSNKRAEDVLPTAGPILISVKRASELLSISEATFWRWVKFRTGFPRPLKVSPGCTRIRLRDLTDFVASLGAGK